MADPVVSYPFDPTGQSASNRIVGEQIIILPPGDRLFHYAMPKFAPMFEDGHAIKLRDLNNNVIPLIKGKDYYLTHRFMDASLATMKPIFGSITFLRRDIVGTIVIDYQTLGGVWTIDSAKITEILADSVKNPRITTWEQVVSRPVDFPVIDHLWNLDDMVGQKEILAVLQKFLDAYLLSLDPTGSGAGSGILAAHINNKMNPHGVTAAQVGAYSIAEITSILTGYVKATDAVGDSLKLGGKTYAEVITTVVNTKVNAAVNADKATLATTATLATDSTKLGGKTLAEVMTDVVATKVAAAVKADSATTATSAILASDSTKLGGKTLAEVMTSLAGVKVNNAIQADMATNATNAALAVNATKFDGKTWTEVLNLLTVASSGTTANAQEAAHAVLADRALNSDALEGKSLVALMADVSQASVANATKFNGQTASEFTAAVLLGNAASASKLGTKTYNNIMTDVQAAITAQDTTDTAAFDAAATALNNLISTPAA